MGISVFYDGGSFIRTGKNTYRSLTADKICIHPGSVLFRQDPLFIVAGEIVRTSRMYAMSVSPLTKSLLHQISPSLLNLLENTKSPKEKKYTIIHKKPLKKITKIEK